MVSENAKKQSYQYNFNYINIWEYNTKAIISINLVVNISARVNNHFMKSGCIQTYLKEEKGIYQTTVISQFESLVRLDGFQMYRTVYRHPYYYTYHYVISCRKLESINFNPSLEKQTIHIFIYLVCIDPTIKRHTRNRKFRYIRANLRNYLPSRWSFTIGAERNINIQLLRDERVSVLMTEAQSATRNTLCQ